MSDVRRGFALLSSSTPRVVEVRHFVAAPRIKRAVGTKSGSEHGTRSGRRMGARKKTSFLAGRARTGGEVSGGGRNGHGVVLEAGGRDEMRREWDAVSRGSCWPVSPSQVSVARRLTASIARVASWFVWRCCYYWR